jgi:uncharacterized membrane protein YeaQ/YmgE (transglycosylase-associated protein family)
MLVGIVGGLLGGFLWVNVLNQDEASGWLGALIIAVLGSIIVLFVTRGMRRA